MFAARTATRADPIVRAMNLVGYDAMAVGNHEFDFGLARLEASRRQARFPWLSAKRSDRTASRLSRPTSSTRSAASGSGSSAS